MEIRERDGREASHAMRGRRRSQPRIRGRPVDGPMGTRSRLVFFSIPSDCPSSNLHSLCSVFVQLALW